MAEERESGKDRVRGGRQQDTSGEDRRKDLAVGRSGPGGARESRAENTLPDDSEEVLSQSQRGSAIARGPGIPEKPVDVGAEPYDLEKTPGVPGGMSGMENEGNTGVHRGTAEYPALSEDVRDYLGAKKGQSAKKSRK